MSSHNSPIWRILAASVPGTSHIRSGEGCEDAHSYRAIGDTVILAIADGAGSAQCAIQGASEAVAAAVKSLGNQIAAHSSPLDHSDMEIMLNTACYDAREAIERLVEQGSSEILSIADANTPISPIPPLIPLDDISSKTSIQPSGVPKRSIRDFASTLLIICVTADVAGAAQVGDGAIIVQYIDGTLMSLFEPIRSEYINETDFLTDLNYRQHLQMTVMPASNIYGIALLTDGMQLLAIQIADNLPHPPFFMPLFTFAANPESTSQDLAEFLQSPRVNARTDDDKTMLIAVRT